jgi:hypothetical protein
MIKQLVFGFGFLALMVVSPFMSSTQAYAITAVSTFSADLCPTFIIFKPWYCGLQKSDGNLMQPTTNKDGEKAKAGDDISLVAFIWTIVANVVDDLFRLIGLVSVGYIIWGGYRYMLARGDSGKMAIAKKTITNAITGLILAVLASSIINLFMRIINA